jgi:hypothetical protein
MASTHEAVAARCLDPGFPATAGDKSGNWAELGRCVAARDFAALTAYFVRRYPHRPCQRTRPNINKTISATARQSTEYPRHDRC